MKITELPTMAKVEVVVDNFDAPFVEQLFNAEGAVGWTAIHGLTGFGHSGRTEGRLLFNEDMGNVMLVAVLPPEQLDGVLTGLQQFLKTKHGVVFVSETHVLRPDHFRTHSNA